MSLNHFQHAHSCTNSHITYIYNTLCQIFVSFILLVWGFMLISTLTSNYKFLHKWPTTYYTRFLINRERQMTIRHNVQDLLLHRNNALPKYQTNNLWITNLMLSNSAYRADFWFSKTTGNWPSTNRKRMWLSIVIKQNLIFHSSRT